MRKMLVIKILRLQYSLVFNQFPTVLPAAAQISVRVPTSGRS
jgi:hypothetical protein